MWITEDHYKKAVGRTVGVTVKPEAIRNDRWHFGKLFE